MSSPASASQSASDEARRERVRAAVDNVILFIATSNIKKQQKIE
jgi:hypothetical protein